MQRRDQLPIKILVTIEEPRQSTFQLRRTQVVIERINKIRD